MDVIILVDFGSTYTKLTVVDINNQEIITTSKSLTTVETDIMVGYKTALSRIQKNIEHMVIKDQLVCSSAAGGLKMVAVGLVDELTSEAAKLTCLGSGAKILDVFSQKITHADVQKVIALEPDMLLIAGGTDGGNSTCAIHNVRMLSEHIDDIPYVISCNKNAVDDICELLDQTSIYYKVTENVMPKLNQVNIDPAKEVIRSIFMDKIIEAKGLSQVRSKLNPKIIPTPLAVLKATELLSRGTYSEDGLGSIMVVDIGGATTDIHSASDGMPTHPGTVYKGLIEPYFKRTVEGDLGMRVSLKALVAIVGVEKISMLSGYSKQAIIEKSNYLSDHIESIATKENDISFDDVIASSAVELAIKRHVGRVEAVYSPMGLSYYQTGKDLSKVNVIIGTGGVIVHNKKASQLLMNAMSNINEPEILKPKQATYLIDVSYILSAAGLLADKYPELSLNLMKKNLIKGDTNEVKK